jgi:hypothetical protein
MARSSHEFADLRLLDMHVADVYGRSDHMVKNDETNRMTPQLRALTKTLATWLAAITPSSSPSASLPSFRPGGYSIYEDAWIQMLHTAFAERLQFGQDILFTFGRGDFFTAETIRRRTSFQSLYGLFSPVSFGGRRGALSPISSKIRWFLGCG